MGIASKLNSGAPPVVPSGPSAPQTSTPPPYQSAPAQYPQVQAQQYPAIPYGQPGIYGQQPQGQGNQSYGGPAQTYAGQGSSAPSSLYGQQMPQGQQYGVAQQATGFDLATIQAKLQKMVAENRLQRFYPPQQVEQLAQRVARIDLAAFGAKWKLTREITLDLVTLALYDIVIWADDSTSMSALDSGERIEDLKAVLGRVADAATLFDDDGISIRMFNSRVQGDNLRNSAEVSQLLSTVTWEGYTPLGSGLEEKCIIPFVITPARNNFLRKPVLIITITDGEPTGPNERRDTTKHVIVRAKDYLSTLPYGSGSVAFMFAQVGKDMTAANFLGELDKDPQVGQMIDCVSDYEIEQEEYLRKGIDLTPDVYLVKLMVGAVDRSYDEADEG